MYLYQNSPLRYLNVLYQVSWIIWLDLIWHRHDFIVIGKFIKTNCLQRPVYPKICVELCPRQGLHVQCCSKVSVQYTFSLISLMSYELWNTCFFTLYVLISNFYLPHCVLRIRFCPQIATHLRVFWTTSISSIPLFSITFSAIFPQHVLVIVKVVEIVRWHLHASSCALAKVFVNFCA